MYETKEDLTGNEYNGLKVLRYNLEKSRIRQKAMYDCLCLKCGKEATYEKSRLIKLLAFCSCSGKAIENMKQARLEKSKQKALEIIAQGYVNGKSKVIRYNEEKTLQDNISTVDLICSECGKEYSAPLSYVLVGKYKTCNECGGKGHSILSTMKEDLIGKTFGNYKVKEFSHTENGRSWWKCYNIPKQKDVVVSRDTLYQSERNRIAKLALKEYNTNGNLLKQESKKIPFTFINKG